MDLITIVAIATGLSFDTFAVSLSCGLVQSKIRILEAIRIALVMAFFQAGFAVIGILLGSTISEKVKSVDHWIAFGLLGFLGVRMIFEGIKNRQGRERWDITGLSSLLTMATGTSIDAFAVGISLAFFNVSIWLPGSVIGIITFLSSMIAIRIGKSVGEKIGKWVELAGGIILIVIGLKILFEHLSA